MTNAFLLVVILLVINSHAYSANSEPIFKDVKYGKHERNTLDFWKAKSTNKTPLVIYFHGGGFKAGDKSNVNNEVIKECLKRGVSVAAVNYRFLEHTNNSYLKILADCEDALEYILKNKKKWNINTKKIAVFGGSAGALISEWLGCKSKSVSVVGAFLQPKGTDEILLEVHKKFPPIFIFQKSGPDDPIHHPKYAKMLKDKLDKIKVENEVWGNDENDFPSLPDGEKPHLAMLKFFFKEWKLKW